MFCGGKSHIHAVLRMWSIVLESFGYSFDRRRLPGTLGRIGRVRGQVRPEGGERGRCGGREGCRRGDRRVRLGGQEIAAAGERGGRGGAGYAGRDGDRDSGRRGQRQGRRGRGGGRGGARGRSDLARKEDAATLRGFLLGLHRWRRDDEDGEDDCRG